MRTVGVVPGSIPLREHLRLQHRRKELAVKQFIAEGCIERFNIPVLPRRARLDVARVDVAIAQVILQRLGNKLRAVVAPEVRRWAVLGEEPVERLPDTPGSNRAGDIDHEALSGVFVDDRHELDLSSSFGGVKQKVYAPNVTGTGGLQARAAVLACVQSAAFALFPWHLQARALP